MKRLTNRMPDGTAYVCSETGEEGIGYFTTQRRLPELISRLAAYEDTGLAPDEIKALISSQNYSLTLEELRDIYSELVRVEKCGYWQGEGDGYADGEIVYDVWTCSECGYTIDDGTDDSEMLPNYCPNCGVKMKKE